MFSQVDELVDKVLNGIAGARKSLQDNFQQAPPDLVELEEALLKDTVLSQEAVKKNQEHVRSLRADVVRTSVEPNHPVHGAGGGGAHVVLHLVTGGGGAART